MRILIFTFLLFCSLQLSAQKNTQPFSIGETDTLYSRILGETRTLNIYLPQDYSPDSAETYSVIYLLDGGADEDFIHVAGLVQFFNFPWINQFPKSIVVGIANTNRKRDFTFSVSDLNFLEPLGYTASMFPAYGGSENFIDFIEKELQPFIEKNYKTSGSKTIIGQSLGGLLTTEILLKKPALFDAYFIISPSLWWNKASLLETAKNFNAQQFNKEIKVYLGVGNEGSMMMNNAKQLSALLKKNKKVNIQFDYLSGENHATISHAALYNGFKRLYPEKK